MSETGVPIRFPALAELTVDTVDRYKTSSTSFLTYWNQDKPITPVNFTYQARQALLQGYFTRIGLTDLQLEWSCPNINPRNNYFAIAFTSNDDPTPYLQSSILQELNPQFYNMSTLVRRMAEEMSDFISSALNIPQTSSFVGSVRQQNGDPNSAFMNISSQCDFLKFAFIPPNNIDFGNTNLISRRLLGAVPEPIEQTTDNERLAKFYKTAGITNRNSDVNFSTPFTFVSSLYKSQQTFGFTTNLSFTNYIDIVSHSLSKYSRVKDAMTREFNGQNDVLARVYLTPYNTQERFVGTAPFTFSVDYTTPKYIRWNPDEYINNFDIQLFDEYGEELYWDELYDTEFQLTVSASET